MANNSGDDFFSRQIKKVKAMAQATFDGMELKHFIWFAIAAIAICTLPIVVPLALSLISTALAASVSVIYSALSFLYAAISPIFSGVFSSSFFAFTAVVAVAAAVGLAVVYPELFSDEYQHPADPDFDKNALRHAQMQMQEEANKLANKPEDHSTLSTYAGVTTQAGGQVNYLAYDERPVTPTPKPSSQNTLPRSLTAGEKGEDEIKISDFII